MSRITGSLSKGIAKLTFDDKYKKDLATSKQPKNVGEGLVKGAKGLLGVRQEKIYHSVVPHFVLGSVTGHCSWCDWSGDKTL